jgi:hypothetical protein
MVFQTSQTRHSSEAYSESYCFPCYALAGFLLKILSPLAGKFESFIQNSNFIQLLKSVNLLSLDTLISYDVVSLFFSLMYLSTKLYRSSEMRSIMMTLANSLSCR